MASSTLLRVAFTFSASLNMGMTIERFISLSSYGCCSSFLIKSTRRSIS